MEAPSVQCSEFGHPQHVLKVRNKVVQPPKEKEVLVKMIASPINPSDLIPVKGSYAHRIDLPYIPGYEGVGIVQDVGSHVAKNMIGKRVLPLRGEGTWQTFVKTSADYVVPMPDTVPLFTAAQLYINPVTAWVICTQKLQLKPGDTLLVNACGSSIGRIFAQFSRVLGFHLIAITRNNDYTETLLNLGASHVINTARDSMHDAVMDITKGKGASAAVDSIGGHAGNDLAFCVQRGGTFLTLGLLSGVQVDWARINREAKVNPALFHLRHWNQQVSINRWQQTFVHLLELVHTQKLTLMEPGPCFPITELNQALQTVITTKGNHGKIFLTGD